MRRGARLVEVRVPQAGRRDERAACLPIDAGRVDDVAALVQSGAQQCVAAGLGVENQIERPTGGGVDAAADPAAADRTSPTTRG